MTATAEKPVVYTASGQPLSIVPGTEEPISADEMERQIAEWRTRYGHLLVDCSTDQFIAEKRRNVEMGRGGNEWLSSHH